MAKLTLMSEGKSSLEICCLWLETLPDVDLEWMQMCSKYDHRPSRVLIFCSVGHWLWKIELLCFSLDIKRAWHGPSLTRHFREKSWWALSVPRINIALSLGLWGGWCGHGCDWSSKPFSTWYLGLWVHPEKMTSGMSQLRVYHLWHWQTPHVSG